MLHVSYQVGPCPVHISSIAVRRATEIFVTISKRISCLESCFPQDHNMDGPLLKACYTSTKYCCKRKLTIKSVKKHSLLAEQTKQGKRCLQIFTAFLVIPRVSDFFAGLNLIQCLFLTFRLM
jgi:hypothetical protein